MVNPNFSVFDATGGTKTINVNIPHEFRVVGYPSWVSYTPSAGTGNTVISITANPYSGEDQRQGSFVVADMYTNKAYVITLIQDSTDEELLVAIPVPLVFTKAGGVRTLKITSNIDWTIE